MINYDKILELKEKLYLHDECVFIKDVLKHTEQFATFAEINEVLQNPETYSILHIPPKKDEFDNVGATPILQKSGWLRDSDRQVLGDKLFENNHSILVTNWEKKNLNCEDLLVQLLKIFYVKFKGHGIWPAQRSSRGGHVHMYSGRSESNSFSAHTDYPNNIIFQIEGKSRWTFYKNRVSTLVGKDDLLLRYKDGKEKKENIFDKLEIQQSVIAEPGDMCYIPPRTFHKVEPITDRISISFPLVLTGPWAHGGI